MVQLEGPNGRGSIHSDRSFNSYMVQLEDVDISRVTVALCRFNSYMVQLEVEQRIERSMGEPVLIPIWCNWKVGLFYFFPPTLRSFNSYMVQLEEVARLHRVARYIVLIPIWCNWKCRLFAESIPPFRFNSYMVQLEASARITLSEESKF